MSALIVVGAGPSGLGCATALAEAGHDVIMFDRIPVPGGESGWAAKAVRMLAGRATTAGVRSRLGVTAVGWSDRQLLVVGPDRIERVRGEHLFFAGGLRPATAADLRVDGERPAGVLPATVAEHLLSTGTRLWRRAVVLGAGPWAAPIAHEVRAAGGHVVAVTDARVDWADEHVLPVGGVTLVGRRRVTGAHVPTVGGSTYVEGDVVVLADSPRPNRNVEGAVDEGAADVTFVQPVEERGIDERARAGRRFAQTWIESTGGRP